MKPVAFSIDDISFVPRKGVIKSRADAKLHPFLWSAPMDTVTGYDLTEAMVEAGHNAVISRFIPREEYLSTIKDFANNNENVFVAIGIDANYDAFEKMIDDLFESTDYSLNLALDVAHGDSFHAYKAISKLRAWKNINYIMGGSICSTTALHDQISSGVTHLRIGVGPGASCQTRRMTGFGIPNAYAVMAIHNDLIYMGQRHRIRIIADGGIKDPGQASKYLMLGADGVMLGHIFSRTREAVGWKARADGEFIKTFRGQASAEFQNEILHRTSSCPEGVSLEPMLWDGTTADDIIHLFEGGVRSAVSYAGLIRSHDLPYAETDLVFLTPTGVTEGTPHGLLRG